MDNNEYILLLIGSFVATFIGSLVGIGGGFIILGLLSFIFPLTVMVPLLAVILACIDMNRVVVFRAHYQADILYPFSLGALVGVSIGSVLFVSLSETIIGTGLGLLILLSLLEPTKNINLPVKHPFAYLGVLHSFFSTMFGFGGLLQAAMLRTKLGNLQITATLASCFLTLEILKVISYALGGFNYFAYTQVILVSICGAIPASILGKAYANKLSLKVYRQAQKLIVAVIALHIFYRVWG